MLDTGVLASASVRTRAGDIGFPRTSVAGEDDAIDYRLGLTQLNLAWNATSQFAPYLLTSLQPSKDRWRTLARRALLADKN